MSPATSILDDVRLLDMRPATLRVLIRTLHREILAGRYVYVDYSLFGHTAAGDRQRVIRLRTVRGALMAKALLTGRWIRITDPRQLEVA